MREILFRGYSKIFKEWLYGRLIVAGADMSNTFCIVKNSDMEMDGHHIRQVSDRPLYVDKESIGEFTGCLDKNGQKIFEDDIVECCSWNEFFSDGSGKTLEPFRRRAVVKFVNGGFKLVERMKNEYACYPAIKPVTWDVTDYSDIIVIGNKFENPELLEITHYNYE